MNSEKRDSNVLNSLFKICKKKDETKHWNDGLSKKKMFSREKVNKDLTAYVTEKALAGLFYNIGLEEQKIRKDPAAQVTGILKTVFGGK